MEKKILIAESGTGFGGSAKYLASLLPLLDRRKFSVELAACGSGPFIQQIEKDGWTIHHVPNWRFPWKAGEHKRLPAPLEVGAYAALAGIQLLTLVPWIVLWLRRRRIQLVHLNNEILSHLPLLLAARISGARTICHLHGWRHLTRTEKWASRYVDQFISVTQSGADFYGWQLRGRTVLGIPNGLSPEAQTEDVAEKRKIKRDELKLGEHDVLAVIVGRMIPLKGHSVFFKALAEAHRKCSRLRGLVVGNDPSVNGIYGKKLREELSAVSLDELVTFLPWQDHMGPVYEASDLVVQPSVDPESFGYVALEGMMAGKPVIASRIGGLVDVVQDGETGFLVEPGNSDELAQAIGRIAEDPALSAELGKKGMERATTLFTIARNAARIQEVYEKMLFSKERT